MFASIGRTWSIVKICWAILQKDRELVVFPICSGISAILIVLMSSGLASGLGALDRLFGESELTNGDYIFLLILYFVLSFVIMFFNSALVGAAMVRIRGGNPTVKDGLGIAMSRISTIAGWAVISASVGLVLRILSNASRRSDNVVGQIAVAIGAAAWGYTTFFVIPVLVVENVGPIESIKRSKSLLKQTWGEQVTANFGFGILGFFAFLVAMLPAFVFAQLSPALGLVLAVLGGISAALIVTTMDGIFKAALYEYAAEDLVADGFETNLLRDSYKASH